MKNKRAIIAVLVVLAVVIIAARAGYSALSQRVNAPAPQPTEQTQPADDAMTMANFTVLDAQGQQVSFSSLAGKPTVINIWATWCPYCVAEMADYQQLYNLYGNDVNFMMIDYVDGQRETVETGQAYIDENGYTFPVYFDTTLEAVEACSAAYLPTTVVVDANGAMVHYQSGAINPDDMGMLLYDLTE